MAKIQTSRLFLQFVKTVTVVLCLICFVFNSYAIFETFSAASTITSINVQRNSRLFLPSMTICSSSGFKGDFSEYSHAELEYYLNNTLNLEEFLSEAFISPSYSALFNSSYQSALLSITSTYSGFRGRCFTFEYKNKVKITYPCKLFI